MSDPVAVVTGAASGIGLALTEFLLTKHWKVVMADLNPPGDKPETRFLKSYKDRVLFHQTDVANFQDQASLFKAAFTWSDGRLEFFAANAGIADRQSIYESEDAPEGDPGPLNLDAIRVDLDAVLQGIWLFKHYCRRSRGPGGKVVITSSAAGLYPMATCPQYAAAKHALVGLTRSCGPTFLKEGITVNCICPAFVPSGLAPPAIMRVFPKEHITPMATVLKAFETFLADDTLSGQTVEVSLDQLYFRQQPPYPNESQRWLGEESAALWEAAYPTAGSREDGVECSAKDGE